MPQIFAIILISRKTANPNSTGQLYYCEKSVNNAFKVVTKPALLLTIDFCTDVLLSHQPICLMLFSLKVSVSRSFNTIFCLLLLSDFKAVDKLLAIWYFFQSFCFFFERICIDHWFLQSVLITLIPSHVVNLLLKMKSWWYWEVYFCPLVNFSLRSFIPICNSGRQTKMYVLLEEGNKKIMYI